jgi:hypothetical protein
LSFFEFLSPVRKLRLGVMDFMAAMGSSMSDVRRVSMEEGGVSVPATGVLVPEDPSEVLVL